MKEFSTYKRPVTKNRPDFKNDVWSKTNGKCHYCGCDLLPFGGEKNSFTVDHIIPIKNGGEHNIDNVVPACKSCNCRKGAR